MAFTLNGFFFTRANFGIGQVVVERAKRTNGIFSQKDINGLQKVIHLVLNEGAAVSGTFDSTLYAYLIDEVG